MSIRCRITLNTDHAKPRHRPFTSGKGAFAGLILKGKRSAIEALCDRVLNNPFKQPGPPSWQLGPFGFGRRRASPWVFKPFSDAVLLFAGRWEGMEAATRVGMGSANEDQVSLWVPVKARNESTGEEKLYMMVPYMFVDNPMSLLNGREDYGYQKSLARFPHTPLNPEGAASVWAFGGEFGPGQTAECHEVMKVEPLAGAAPGGPQPAESGKGGEDPFPVAVLIKMLKDGVDQVFLKQFRDIATPPPLPPGAPPGAVAPGKACYQHLVQARVVFVNPDVKITFKPWRVELTTGRNSTLPIEEDLGLEVASTTPFSFELRSELKLESGAIIV